MSAKIKAKVKTAVKKKPIKAGSTHYGSNTGGVLNAKMAAIVKKKRDK